IAGLGAAGLILAPRRARAAPSPVVQTTAGPVRGYLDGAVSVFKGVPYGADTAPRRFQPPLPPAPWREVRDAAAYGPASPQRSREAERQSEDCLCLNVWTPEPRAGGRRPVMLYIHGGA